MSANGAGLGVGGNLGTGNFMLVVELMLEHGVTETNVL